MCLHCDLTMLFSTTAARYIRTLVLLPYDLGVTMHKKPIGSTVRMTWRLLRRCKIRAKPSGAAAAGRLLKLVESMTNMNSLVIEAPKTESCPLSDVAVKFIRASLSAHNLRSLTLTTPNFAILKSALTIPALEEFNITLYKNDDPDDGYPTLISFLAHQSQTLNTIAVHIHDFDLDSSSFFGSLPFSPVLPILLSISYWTISHRQRQPILTYFFENTRIPLSKCCFTS